MSMETNLPNENSIHLYIGLRVFFAVFGLVIIDKKLIVFLLLKVVGITLLGDEI